MTRILLFCGAAFAASLMFENVRDFFEIRWTAFRLEREARSTLKDQASMDYVGIVSESVWIDVGGQRELTRTNTEQSTFDRWVWVEAGCKNCILDISNAVILDRGHGEYHGTAQPVFESRSVGAAILIEKIGFSAECRRENKVFGGGCRSIVAAAVGYVEIPEIAAITE